MEPHQKRIPREKQLQEGWLPKALFKNLDKFFIVYPQRVTKLKMFNKKFGYHIIIILLRYVHSPQKSCEDTTGAWTSHQPFWVCIFSAGPSISLCDFDQVTSLFRASGS